MRRRLAAIIIDSYNGFFLSCISLNFSIRMNIISRLLLYCGDTPTAQMKNSSLRITFARDDCIVSVNSDFYGPFDQSRMGAEILNATVRNAVQGITLNQFLCKRFNVSFAALYNGGLFNIFLIIVNLLFVSETHRVDLHLYFTHQI